MKSNDPLNAFISYSHEDKQYLVSLKKHITILEKNGLLKVWDDTQLNAGDELLDEIHKYLIVADILILLVSVDFLNSFPCDKELKEILEKNKNTKTNKVAIIPIIVRECAWKKTILGNYIAIPKDGKPVSTFSDKDSAWVNVCEEIEKVAEAYNKINERFENKLAIKPGIISRKKIEVENNNLMGKEYTFKKIKIPDDEKIWLKAFYDKLKTFYYNEQGFNVLDVPIRDIINELKVDLYGKLRDFDYQSIDGNLFRADHLTLIGLWYIDPESNIFNHVTKIISYIKELILSGKKPNEIIINDIVSETQLKEVDVQVALYLIRDIGTFWHARQFNHLNTGYLSISIDNEYDIYLNFDNIEDLMEDFYKINYLDCPDNDYKEPIGFNPSQKL
jgi:hypothetical protein